MKQHRHWVSWLLAVNFIAVLVSGAMLFSQPYSNAVAAIHVCSTLVITVIVGFHIANNFPTLQRYLDTHGRKVATRSLLVALVVVLGAFLGLPPFGTMVDFSRDLRGAVEVEANTLHQIETAASIPGAQGEPLQLRLTAVAGEHFTSEPIDLDFFGITFRTIPQFAIWLEDEQGNYLTTLYLTAKAADSSYQSLPFTGAPDVVRRPEALPVWSHKRGKQTEDGLYMPSPQNPVEDAITSATPVGHYQVNSLVKAAEGDVILKMEINRSFDFNEFWHREKFPEDPIYSGTGSSGQPSLVYQAKLSTSTCGPRLLEIVGRGHHSGQTGEIYGDLEGFTTALQLVAWAAVENLSGDCSSG